MAGLCAPLPTLRRRPRGRLRTDRGRRGLLLLHRSGLSPHTPCQSPGALTRVAACTLARSPYFVTRYPKASDISSPPCLLRLLPAGAVVGWGLHQLESAALSRHTPTAVIYPGSGNASAPEPEFGSRVTTNVTRAGIAPKCRTLALCAIDRTSGRCARTRVSPDHLRRLPQGAQEGAAQAGAIGEARLPSDDVDRMPALLHHQPGGLDAQVLDSFGRG